MKSVFDAPVREELISRVHAVSQQNKAQWGKMNAYQMLLHCTLCEDMFLGKLNMKRVFIGRLIGPMVLKKVLKDDKPFGKNSPTSDVLKTTAASGDIEQQKKEWISRVEQYAHHTSPGFVHPFFGPMTTEQIGRFVYKHADHHLRQFGA
ncbi:MAG: DinB family protein [Chitinophagaceae bacterium]|nr:DinB family protein [Chitinophagaceae bacterium]